MVGEGSPLRVCAPLLWAEREAEAEAVGERVGAAPEAVVQALPAAPLKVAKTEAGALPEAPGWEGEGSLKAVAGAEAAALALPPPLPEAPRVASEEAVALELLVPLPVTLGDCTAEVLGEAMAESVGGKEGGAEAECVGVTP